MKKIISLIVFMLVLVMLAGFVPVYASVWYDFDKEGTVVRDGFTFDVGRLTVEYEDWDEESLGNVAYVTKYTGTAETVVVPEEVDGYRVWEISDDAFDNVPAKKIVIPDTVESLGRAFVNCPNLETVEMGKALPSTDRSYLSILSFTRNCPSFKAFSVSPDNRYYTTIDKGVLIKDSKFQGYDYYKTIVDYPEGRDDESYFLRKEVRLTSETSFAYTSKLKYVSFGYEKMRLELRTFYNSSVVAIMFGKGCEPSSYLFDASNVKYVFYKGTKDQWNNKLIGGLRSDCVKDKNIKVTYNAKDITTVFTDVKTTSWYRGATEFAYNAGLMDGVAKDRFGPGDPETRAMLVATLWRLEGKPKAKKKAPFTDLKQDWYIPAVNWAYEKGIVDGLTKTKFSPGGTLTREQLATIMYRYAEYKKLDTKARADLSGYKDASKIHSYAKDAVSWAVASGLIKGTAPKKLSPLGITTRAQVATILLRQA